MAFWNEILRRAGYLTRRARFDEELHDEVQFHLAARRAELEKSGLSPDDAARQARR